MKIEKKINKMILMMVGICIISLSGYSQSDNLNIRQVIKKRIEDIKNVYWGETKIKYEEVKKSITKFEGELGNDVERNRSYLEVVYAEVLVRDSKKMMNGVCVPEHKKLRQMSKEVDRMSKVVSDATDLKCVQDRIKKHDEVLGFINQVRLSRVSAVKVSSKYSETYSNDVLSKMRDYQIEKWSCTSIKEGLAKIPSYLNDHHKDFLNRMVDDYLQRSEYDESLENDVSRQIQNYYSDRTKEGAYSKYGTSSNSALQFCQGLIDKVEVYRKKKQEEKNIINKQ